MENDEVLQLALEDHEKQVFRTPVFEGPLDLLLWQIQKAEVNILNLPIAEITDQFIQYIHEHESSLKNLSEFYKMAADLLYIKSRFLLPEEVVMDEEYEDPRQELVERLLEYQKFKKYTDLLTGVVTSDSFYIPRKENLFNVPFTDKDLFKGIELSDLLKTFQSLMEKVSPNKLFNIYEEVSINEKRTLLDELLESNGTVTISQLIVDPNNPLHIICSFMAILEACKDRMIIFNQPQPLGEIYIVRRPKDYDERLAEEYDRDYDEVVEQDLEEADDFSIITREAKEREREEYPEEFSDDEEDGTQELDLGEEEDLLDDDED
ncbi:MAG: segregation/condensation protein A [Spirochaetales bacterium]|nr:segregation/condensation protein A [Spirochaetales bacterium]